MYITKNSVLLQLCQSIGGHVLADSCEHAIKRFLKTTFYIHNVLCGFLSTTAVDIDRKTGKLLKFGSDDSVGLQDRVLVASSAL